MRGDNASAIAWMIWCRGGKEPRSGPLMRMNGVLEIVSSWNFKAQHLPGLFNGVADGISRWAPSRTSAHLSAVRPDIRWHMQDLGTEEGVCVHTCWPRANPKRPCGGV